MAPAIHLSPRRRRHLFLLAAAALSGYGAYRLYTHPSIARKRRQLSRLAAALLSLADAAETLSLLSSDLNSFLRSDSDDLPPSLKQLSKIAASQEFTSSLSSISQALTLGIARGFGAGGPSSTPSFSDRVIEKLASPAGTGFVSVVVGSFARNFVLGFYSAPGSGGGLSSESEGGWIGFLCSNDKCRELIADSIQRFVSTAVTVYLDRTLGINTYDELFSGLTNPKHEVKLRELLVSVCNGAVDTLVRTSHQVITSSASASSLKGAEELTFGSERRMSVADGKGGSGSGWVDQVSSTLAVPSNRRFVLDVAGQVTFETVRSFLEFTMSKVYDGTKRGVNSVREDAVEKGLEVVKYVSAKSMAVYAICLALCMRMLSGTRIMMPA